MRFRDRAQYWNTTPAERAASYRCEAYARSSYRTYLRAVDVAAPAGITFRWICQLTVAPYSYDWLDNGGRTSPRTLTPGADEIGTGQRFLIARVTEFEPGVSMTGVSTPRPTAIFGPIALTYQATPTGPDASRLLAAMTVSASTPLARARRELLGWGDLLMMRKQLLTLKELAEQHTVRHPGTSTATSTAGSAATGTGVADA